MRSTKYYYGYKRITDLKHRCLHKGKSKGKLMDHDGHEFCKTQDI